MSELSEEARLIRARVDQLRAKATGPNADPEEDHGKEDSIYFSTLKAIAEGAVSDPQACAAEAIKAADIEFSRWYA